MEMKKQRIILFLLIAALWGVPRSAEAQIFAVRADALAALTGTLHLGAEVAVEVSGYWNPINTSDISMNFHAVQLGSRYWFYESFVGHFVGGQLSYVGYDLGNRTKHYDGRAYAYRSDRSIGRPVPTSEPISLHLQNSISF